MNSTTNNLYCSLKAQYLLKLIMENFFYNCFNYEITRRNVNLIIFLNNIGIRFLAFNNLILGFEYGHVFIAVELKHDVLYMFLKFYKNWSDKFF